MTGVPGRQPEGTEPHAGGRADPGHGNTKHGDTEQGGAGTVAGIPVVDVMAVLAGMQDQLDDLAATVAAQQQTIDELVADRTHRPGGRGSGTGRAGR